MRSRVGTLGDGSCPAFDDRSSPAPDRGAFGAELQPRFWPLATWFPPGRFALALAPSFVAVLLCLVLDPRLSARVPFMAFFPAVMVAGWLAGLWAGIISAAICAASILYFDLQPTRAWALSGVGLFVALGVLISLLNESWRRAASAVLAANDRFRHTLASVADGVITADEHGRVTGLNAVAERLTGWHAADAIGQPLDTVFTIQESPWQTAPAARSSRVLNGTTTATLDGILLVARDGAVRPVEGSATPIRPGQQRTIGLVLTFRDVSARRRAQEEQAALLEQERQVVQREQAARAELQRANALKDGFLAVLSHELRTPMNAVLGYARLLSAGVLPGDRVGAALAAIQRNAQAQARLIESLLDSSRIVAGKLTIACDPVELTPVLEAAIDAVRLDAAAKGVGLHAAVPGERVTLMGDAGRLQQVFWNLLSNAVKFTPPGGRIDIRVERQPGTARVIIEDNGVGIPADLLPYIFDRFVQADRDGTDATRGLGLGLALVREVVRSPASSILHSHSSGTRRAIRSKCSLSSRC